MDQRHKAPVFILSLGVCWHGCQVQTCETETKGNGKLVAIFEMFEGGSWTILISISPCAQKKDKPTVPHKMSELVHICTYV